MAAQGRRPEDETLDDRLAVFLEDRARRRRIAEDDLAALTESRTGRLHLIRLARTTDPETARPILAREFDRLRAERAARAKSPPDDGSRPLPGDGDGRAPGRPGPPDDGSRPIPGDGDGRAPGYPGPPDDGFRPLPGDEEPPPKPKQCANERRAVEEAEEEVARLRQALEELTEDYEETVAKIEALRARIKELETAAAREAAADAAPPNAKLFMDKNGRIKAPSKIEVLALLLEMAVRSRIANRGENAALAEIAKRDLQSSEDKLPMLRQAIDDTRARLQTAEAALERAIGILRACQSLKS